VAISSAELAAVSNEIQKTGKRQVEKIYHPSEHELVFTFREEKAKRLFINASLKHGSIFLTQEKTESPKTPSAFAGLLRKHISGSRLVAIEKKQNDRQISLLFSPGEVRLFCRFFGQGGFILTGSDGKILGHCGFASSREIRAGALFLPPKQDATDEETAEFENSPSAELEIRYGQNSNENDKDRILSAINRELKKLQKLKKNLENDLEKLSSYSEYKKMGDLCKIYFHKLRRGESETVLQDPETDEGVTIPLKPELSPAENIALIYKKHHKYASGKERLESTLFETNNKIETLMSDMKKTTSAELSELDPLINKYLGSQKLRPATTTKKREQIKSDPFRRFTSTQGFDIFVGKSGLQNDELLRKSNGNDMWFHVRGFPGSHVVLKASRIKDIPHDAIVEAAKLALKYSTRAKDGKGEIVYTYIKNVKKIKNTPPGKVSITREKTISVKLD